MIVEAIYRDSHKERFCADTRATLAHCALRARDLYDRVPLKHLKIVEEKSDKSTDPSHG